MGAPLVTIASPGATYRRLLGYSAKYWPIAIIAFIGMVFDAACGAMFTYLIKPMLDDLFDKRDPESIFWMPIIIIALFVVRGMATFAADFGVARIGRGVVQTMREEVFNKYLRMPASYFHKETSGSLISRMTYTVEQVANASTDAVKTMLMDGFMVIGLAFVMFVRSPRLVGGPDPLGVLTGGEPALGERRAQLAGDGVAVGVGGEHATLAGWSAGHHGCGRSRLGHRHHLQRQRFKLTDHPVI